MYLHKFCDEINDLIKNGVLISDTLYKVELRSFIADAPARAMIKETAYHGGRYGCDRCEVKGIHKNGSMSFEDLKAKKRSNESFRNQAQIGHHKGISPLIKIENLDIISQFPLDYMHLVLLGIMRRIIHHWNREVPHKLSNHQKTLVNANIDMVKKNLPADFNRLPRKLDDAERFKATEFRTMLLYSACIIFHKILDSEKYNHFMLLMFAIRIFCNPELIKDEQNINYGQKLCILFVKQYPKLYKTNIVYNVHSLIHLGDDVRKFGVLDSISAFPYETMIGKIKKTCQE